MTLLQNLFLFNSLKALEFKAAFLWAWDSPSKMCGRVLVPFVLTSAAQCLIASLHLQATAKVAQV